MASKSVLFALFVTVLSVLITSGSCWRIWLFRDKDHKGGHIEMSGEGCQNLPGDFNDRTSSVNTHGGCVRLYEHGGCTGDVRDVFMGSGAHNDLGALGFNDKVTSVGNCPRRRRDAAFDSFKTNSFDSHRWPRQVKKV
ncbi:uncharacterized protein LOC103509026 [Diaphorina citri]|uniref:Uncharacterized protein LOC103509026 n=1 Tax=Diaphorina citri TaxID=121845 RepID=A0A3Q0IYH4_DIACI|nr:uncharacterized protein LOC103509026 [Diaphorina citri]